jgi:hypothetical protein
MYVPQTGSKVNGQRPKNTTPSGLVSLFRGSGTGLAAWCSKDWLNGVGKQCVAKAQLAPRLLILSRISNVEELFQLLAYIAAMIWHDVCN